MKCQEVMEYMQRHLDEDLSKQEHEILQQHMNDCIECTLMFQRLNQLSDELVNLPKVTPPMNLVDSIMPRIEELDRMAKADKQHKVSVPFWKGKSFRTVGSVVAASVAVIAIIAYGPFKLSGTEQADYHANHSMNTAANIESEQLHDSPLANVEESGATSFRASNQAGDSFLFSSEPLFGEMNETGSTEPAQRAADMGTMDAAPSSPPLSRAINPEETANKESQGKADGIVDTEKEELVTITSSANRNNMMDVASTAAPTSDGAYSAFAEYVDLGMQMIILNQDGDRIYASPLKRIDKLVSMSWSKSDYSLTYTVTKDNVETIYTIHVESRTETIHD